MTGGGAGGGPLGSAVGWALAAALLLLLWRQKRANANPVWRTYLPEVPPA